MGPPFCQLGYFVLLPVIFAVFGIARLTSSPTYLIHAQGCLEHSLSQPHGLTDLFLEVKRSFILEPSKSLLLYSSSELFSKPNSSFFSSIFSCHILNIVSFKKLTAIFLMFCLHISESDPRVNKVPFLFSTFPHAAVLLNILPRRNRYVLFSRLQ